MNVGSIKLKLEQLNTLFSYICDKSIITLKVLDLFVNHIVRRLEPGLLARAVTRLEQMCFGRTNLTAEQATAVFRDICDKSNLKLKVLDLR